MYGFKTVKLRTFAALALGISAFVGRSSALSAKEASTPAAVTAPVVVADYPVNNSTLPVVKSTGANVQKTSFVPKADQTRALQTGVASYYGPGFHGRRTANGERFDMNAMTAAHRTLPFGTLLKVTNLDNGQSAIVRVNDRGPFIKGRVLDLSVAAAKQIGSKHSGTASVKIELVEN
jgi:rare lipoprotein A